MRRTIGIICPNPLRCTIINGWPAKCGGVRWAISDALPAHLFSRLDGLKTLNRVTFLLTLIWSILRLYSSCLLYFYSILFYSNIEI